MDVDSMKRKFYEHLGESVRGKKDNNCYITNERYTELLAEVREAKSARPKLSVHYRRLKRYDILSIGGEDKLIAPLAADGEIVLYYVRFEELFDILHETHSSVGHGGRTRMIVELARKYKNATTEAVTTYLQLCEVCQKKKGLLKKGAVVRPILHSEMNSRCQIDLIDMQSNPDGDKRFIMMYQDHLTKFVLLRALRTKTADEVAHHLLDVFSTFGAPNILHSDNGREFCNETITSLCKMWDGVKVVHGKPRHSQSQGSVERANRDIEDMLSAWMETNGTTEWSRGLSFVQAMKNRAYHEGIRCSPYEAMFGVPMKLGLTSLAGLRNVFKDLHTEEDLESAMNIESDHSVSTTTTTDNSEATTDTEGGDDDEEEEDVEGNRTDDDRQQDSNLDDDVGTTEETTSAVTTRVRKMRESRETAKVGLEKQAKRMKETSLRKFTKPDIGRNVTVKIPDVDRAKMDPKSVIAVVISTKDGEFYELGTKAGKLNALYTVNQFTLCKERFLSVEDVPDKTVSLRTAVRSLSLVGGQGFKKCNCLQKCVTNRCQCRSSKVLCNSKCHNSQPCNNK